MFRKLFERIKLAISESREPKKLCINCYYFASDAYGFKCVNLNACIAVPRPNGFCPLYVNLKAPTQEQIVKNYLEDCLKQSIQVD